MSLSLTEGIVVVFALLFAAYGGLIRRNSLRRLPPGPTGIPLLGNLLQLSPKRPHPQLLTWARKYGAIVHLRLGPQHMIVLNTAEAADDLLVKRSRNYSSRVSPYVAHEIIGDGQRLFLMPYTRELKVCRRTVQAAVGAGPSKRLHIYQDLESRVTLKDLLDHGDHSLGVQIPGSPTGDLHVPQDHWFCLIRRYTTSLVLSLTYGHRVHRLKDFPLVENIYDVVEALVQAAQPGEYLADSFPLLRRLPDWLAPWRVAARKQHEREMEVWGTLFDNQQAAWKAGTSTECLISSYLTARAAKGHESAPGRGITEDGWMRDKLIAYTAATVLEAGSDTTSTTIETFVLLMLAHPRVLQKAREELDRVVGPDRMPTFEDEPNLPYVVACIKETLRRRPVVPLGVPHMASEDDVYKGFFIPKGSVVVGNVWAVHMDPDRYPNPEAFDPERFYEPGKPTRFGSGNGQDSDRDIYAFGWGRRFCAGVSFAEPALFILCARLIWAFDFCPMNDAMGNAVVPDMMDERNFSNGLVCSPQPFNVGWKARDSRRAAVIERAYAEAQEEWLARGMDQDDR